MLRIKHCEECRVAGLEENLVRFILFHPFASLSVIRQIRQIASLQVSLCLFLKPDIMYLELFSKILFKLLRILRCIQILLLNQVHLMASFQKAKYNIPHDMIVRVLCIKTTNRYYSNPHKVFFLSAYQRFQPRLILQESEPFIPYIKLY